jgi:transcriptional regulator with XRE-family HTH domain
MRQVNAVRLRKALGYSKQKRIADYLGVSSSTVSRWVRGAMPVPDKHIRKLARAVDKTTTWLCGGHND